MESWSHLRRKSAIALHIPWHVQQVEMFLLAYLSRASSMRRSAAGRDSDSLPPRCFLTNKTALELRARRLSRPFAPGVDTGV